MERDELCWTERLKRFSGDEAPALDALAFVSSVQLPTQQLIEQEEEEEEEEQEEEQEQEEYQDRVRAYAKLEFPQHDFFIRKLSIIIGRRPPSNQQQHAIKQEEIDVDLGPIRAVSRKHAALFYDCSLGHWSIQVLGRNGCVVDGRWKAKSEIIPLKSRDSDQSQDHQDKEEEDDDPLCKSDDEPRPPSPPRHQTNHYQERVDFNLIHSESDSDSLDEDDLNSSLELTYSYSFPGKAPASKAPKKTVAIKAPIGRGKSVGGKGSIHTVIPHPVHPTDPTNDHATTTHSELSKVGKGKGKSSGRSKQPPGKVESSLPIKERPKIQCVTPSGAEIGTATQKPPYTYASLITQALAAQADEDGKMLVSEMCEWMAGVYPFYGAKEKGSDWQSAVRHNLNADKRFKRIERMPTDGGKGNFWTLREEEWVNFDGLELRRQKDIKAVNGGGPKAEVKPTGAKEVCKTVIGRQLDGAPSRSIGNVARSDIGTHHRMSAATTLSHSPPAPPPPTRPTKSHGIRPPPPTPSPQQDLPVFSPDDQAAITQPLSLDLPTEPTLNLHPEPAFPHESCLDQPPSETYLPIDDLPPAPPPIDPNLLACSSTPASSIPHPKPGSNGLPPPPPPTATTATTATTTAVSTSTTTPIMTPTTKTTTTMSSSTQGKASTGKFEIVIQEPNGTSTRSQVGGKGRPQTQEELKKLMEQEPPMFVCGNRLVLNQLIFKDLKPQQILSLQKLGPQAAIKILQKFIVGYFKELIKKNPITPSASSKPGAPLGSSSSPALPAFLKRKELSPTIPPPDLPLPSKKLKLSPG
ncbi:uncharacterized protein VP01_390g12 [Puccinia sorghi]|uniref:Pre-rRNA-processing protein fhl1 n=1 Tax=Puccinia sorghi TaxID=27349 RepID=A0A0L6UUL4_9BASI|nr:uncharacterized protein VP01_390g12 [Puccinia sorghi]